MPEGASLLPCTVAMHCLSLSVLDVDDVGQLVDDIALHWPLCCWLVPQEMGEALSALSVSTPRDWGRPCLH